jgi:NADH-quinone oxidoreductase E subunit
MAWITKNSAATQIARRDEPYLTSEIRQHIEQTYLPRYQTKQGALLPTLHAVQARWGWLPHQALIEVADFLGLKPADVIDTASFYEEYWLRPKGEHVIWVCRSIACEFCGHKDIVDACRNKLGIEPGETTDDGKFTLMEIECLGSCGTAPAALIDHTLHENCTPQSIQRAIDDASRHAHHHH